MIKVDFLVIDHPSMYNVILGRPILNKIGDVISMTYLTIKFFSDKGEIAIMKADQAMAHHCYNASLEIQKGRRDELESNFHPPSSSKVIMVDLDARGRQKMKKPKPNRELETLDLFA